MLDQHLTQTAAECALPIETVIPEDVTVEEAMLSLRQKQIRQEIIYFYAVDADHKLKGVVSTRQLLLAEPTATIKSIMFSPVVKVHASQTLREAMELFALHPLLALPVIDGEGKLIGAIDLQMIIQEPINFTDERARFDQFQLIGVTLEEKKKVSLLSGFRHRMPWLLCNVLSGLVCALISQVFEVVLSEVLLLAFFIPLVLTLSESTSMQSMAQSLQFLRGPRFSWKRMRYLAFKEWKLVVFLSFSLALLVGSFSFLWGDGLLPSIAIACGILGGVSFSAIFAIAIPIGLNRLKLDPKVASGPLVLMIADMLTTAIYLGLATWWLI